MFCSTPSNQDKNCCVFSIRSMFSRAVETAGFASASDDASVETRAGATAAASTS
jgi:hypothetical protein